MSTIEVVKDNTPTQLGGRKKKMKRGGEDPMVESGIGGEKKKNGHKANCECPICVNMKHANKSKYTKNKKNKRGGTKKRRGGNDDDDDDEDVADAPANADNSGSDASASVRDARVARAPSHPDGTSGNGETSENVDTSGGRKKKKKNGHKANCKCPICKNTQKGKRGGEGEEVTVETEEVKNDGEEVKATDAEYDELMSGGKRKRTRRHRKHRKTHKKRSRRHRRH